MKILISNDIGFPSSLDCASSCEEEDRRGGDGGYEGSFLPAGV
jgi:hypothetical protein